MHIFIDESGSFVQPRSAHKVAAVGAAVVPEEEWPELRRRFARFVRDWSAEAVELKGSQLSEGQVAQVVALAREHDVLLEIRAIDMGRHDAARIGAFRERQEAQFNDSDGAFDEWTEWGKKAQAAIRSLPQQLFVQCMLTIWLVLETVEVATQYYVQHMPAELRAFRWRIDAKDIEPTEYEQLWTDIILPGGQALSFQRPFETVPRANYRHFQRFLIEPAELPQFLAERVSEIGGTGAVDFTKILGEDRQFLGSRHEPGLQLADFLVNACCRSLNGNLQEDGWRDLGYLMARKPKGAVVPVFLLKDPDERVPVTEPPYMHVLRRFNTTARDVISRRYGGS